MAEQSQVPNSRSIAARANGRKGGMATAKNHSPEWLSERARSGGSTTRDLYSADFFRHAQQQRKVRRGWPAGKLRPARDLLTVATKKAQKAIEASGLSETHANLLNQMLVQG